MRTQASKTGVSEKVLALILGVVPFCTLSAQASSSAFEGMWEGVVSVVSTTASRDDDFVPKAGEMVPLRLQITKNQVTVYVRGQNWIQLGERNQFELLATEIAGTILGAIQLETTVETWILSIKKLDEDSLALFSSTAIGFSGVRDAATEPFVFGMMGELSRTRYD